MRITAIAMKCTQAKITVTTSQLPGILIEKYAYSSGAIEPLPKHSHYEYQLGMCLNCQGEYYYRGANHSVPIGKLSIIHSGEVHSPSQRTFLPQPAFYLMMHIDPNVLQETVSEMGGSNVSVPFFTQPIFKDRILAQQFYSLCTSDRTTQLSRDSLLVDFLNCLVTQNRAYIPQSYKQVKLAIALVRDYLQANYTENISLKELADIAGVSRFYLSRLFRRELGISLSAYQTQIKIDRAKQFLAQGMSISTVATITGFYDQSHFGYHFKRLVGTTPGNYGKSKE